MFELVEGQNFKSFDQQSSPAPKIELRLTSKQAFNIKIYGVPLQIAF